jgi:hypothetical protein
MTLIGQVLELCREYAAQVTLSRLPSLSGRTTRRTDSVALHVVFIKRTSCLSVMLVRTEFSIGTTLGMSPVVGSSRVSLEWSFRSGQSINRSNLLPIPWSLLI